MEPFCTLNEGIKVGGWGTMERENYRYAGIVYITGV
jgi:hypothetical protein